MNTEAEKYRLYKRLLEGDISQQQYDMLLEFSFLQKLGFKAKGVGAAVGGIAKSYRDAKAAAQAAKASENFIEAIRELADANKETQEIMYFTIQKAFKVSKIDISKIADAKDPSAKEGAEEGGGEAELAHGETLSADVTRSAGSGVAIARAAAAATGADPEKAGAKAAESEDPKEAAIANSKILIASLSKSTKVGQDKVSAIFKWLLDNKHIKNEGRTRLTLGDIKRTINELNFKMEKRDNEMLLMERWQHLAGLEPLNEKGPRTREQKDARNTKDREARATKNAGKAGGVPAPANSNASPAAAPADAKTVAADNPGAKPGEHKTDAAPKSGPDTAEVAKRFAKLIDTAVAANKDITKEEITKVFAELDDLEKSIKIVS